VSRGIAFGALAILVALTVSFGPAAGADPSPPGGVTVPITVENTATPVEQPPAADRHLASTGADVISLVRNGIILIAAGLIALAWSRRLGAVR
jgi:hypothetical protein